MQTNHLVTIRVDGGHYLITFERAKGLGLPESDELPKEVHELMSQYGMPANRRPSVMYLRLPAAEGGPRR